MFLLYAKDLSRGRLRDTESTDMVLVSWLQKVAPYDYERIPASEDNRAARAYYSITAERLFFRTQVWSDCTVPAAFLKDKRLLATSPFGAKSVPLAALLRDNVKAAMAYVPLVPEEGGGSRKPLLARLYCVSGLKGPFAHPFAEEGPEGAVRYDWFLSGVDTSVKTSGRSWYLAAAILMKCLESGNPKTVRQKLAREFIFSGAVDARGDVDRVSLDGKLRLADIPEYAKLTWIVSHEQKGEVSGIRATPVRNVDRAYDRVINGMDRATRSLIDLVKGGTPENKLANIYSLLQDNADANLPNEEGLCVRQMIMSNITRKIVELIRTPGLAERPTIDIQDAICSKLAPEWDAEKASSYYGNDPLLFFLAARSKNRKVMQFLKATMNINGVDRDGETALDFALDASDEEAAEFLREYGADKHGCYDIRSKRVRDFLRDPVGHVEGDRDFFHKAFEHNLDPFMETTFGKESDGKGGLQNVLAVRRCWDNLAELEQVEPDPWNSEPWVDISYEKTSVLLEAVLKYNWGVAQMCLDAGKKPLPSISVKVVATGAYITSYLDLARRFSSPVIVRAVKDYMESHP